MVRKTALLSSILALAVMANVAMAQTPKPTDAKPAVVTSGSVTPVAQPATPPASQPAATPAAATTPAQPTPQPTAQPQQYEQSWWQLILKHLIELVFAIIGIMLTILIKVLAAKYHFEGQTAKINDVLARASGFAEQWSIKKAKLDGTPTESAKKLEVAIEFAVKMAGEYKLPQKGSDWWEGKLESWLGVGKDREPTTVTTPAGGTNG